MQDNQDNRNTHPVANDEIEVDLVELFGELKRNWKLIASTTVAFAAAAAIYSFCIAKPVYQYSAMIRIPANIINHSFVVNTSSELLKSDGVATVVNVRNTSLLKLTFSAYTPKEAKILADDYLPKAEARVNEIIKGAYIIALDNSIGNTSLNLGLPKDKQSYSAENKVEVIRQEKGLDIPVSPNRKKNIAIATLLGLLVSCGYTVGKFCGRSKLFL